MTAQRRLLFGRTLTSTLAFAVSVGVHRIAFAQDTDLEVPAAPASADAGSPVRATPPPPVAAAPAPAAASADVAALEARVRQLEEKLANPTPPPSAATKQPDDSPTTVRVEREPSLNAGVVGPLGLVFSGYVQAQYEHNQLSEDQLQQGRVLLNQNRFLVRRARLRVDRAWKWAATAIEIDGNTVRSPSFGLRRAEVAFVWRNPAADAVPYLRVTGGLSEIPFGYEMTESNRSRFFTERSIGSLALFPGEPDLGIRVSGGLGFFRYSIAALNGEPINDRPDQYAGDPNGAKDIVGRFGVDTKPRDDTRVSGGVSFLTGTGFHPGTDATKDAVIWRDLNENGVVDNGEINGSPGVAATPSENFARWAFGADLEASLETKIGRSKIYGEVFVAKNADRGYLVADPVVAGNDLREVGWYVGFLQEITKYAVVGFRTDHYNPNSDLFDSRRGKLVPADASVHTYSPMVGAILPDRLRVLFQYDAIVDKQGRDSSGVPVDLKNDRFVIRLQGEL